jgi:uncharacterized protein YndB with AHSA1/START domain
MEHRIVEIETTIAANIAEVWDALTGEGATVMPMTKVETDWNPGHPIVFSGVWNGKPFEDHGEIVSVLEGKTVSFTHWSGNGSRPDDYHLVTYSLSRLGDSTRVTLVQSNIGPKPEPSEETKAEFSKTFRLMLNELKQASEAR